MKKKIPTMYLIISSPHYFIMSTVLGLKKTACKILKKMLLKLSDIVK